METELQGERLGQTWRSRGAQGKETCIGSGTWQPFIVSLVLRQRFRFRSRLCHHSCVTLCRALHPCTLGASVCKTQRAHVGTPALPGSVHMWGDEGRLMHLLGKQLQSTLNTLT